MLCHRQRGSLQDLNHAKSRVAAGHRFLLLLNAVYEVVDFAAERLGHVDLRASMSPVR